MQILLLYASVVLIWGSTWAAIPFQLGDVAEEVSIGYRFGIAALCLYAFALLARRPLQLPRKTYGFVFLQGTLLFCLNYILVYYATARITSGLVAVIFSSIVLFNAILERVFFGATVTLQDENDETVVYRLVGPDEFDREDHFISIDSPLARSLLKRELGDEVEVQVPRGRLVYLIADITY